MFAIKCTQLIGGCYYIRLDLWHDSGTKGTEGSNGNWKDGKDVSELKDSPDEKL